MFASISFLAVSISPSTGSVIKISCLCKHRQIADGGKQILEQWRILTWTRNNCELWCPVTSVMGVQPCFWTAGLVSAERGCWCWCPLMDSTAPGDCHRPSRHTSDPNDDTYYLFNSTFLSMKLSWTSGWWHHSCATKNSEKSAEIVQTERGASCVLSCPTMLRSDLTFAVWTSFLAPDSDRNS